MDPLAALFTSLARKDLPLLEYAVEFSQLAVLTAFGNVALNLLFWIRANYHLPIDLSDTTELNWREAIIRCPESACPRSRAQPDLEPSPPSPRCAEPKSEPTKDGATELRIATEPELFVTSDQVQELGTTRAMR
ncbi:Nck-associated protein 5 [Labeo rohita]|uniref:Nck-associated protein 5 n=1 Tax=Labeo rohita TaxID=84645 RepID=A0ABQ8LZS7_LABRO|nr:Nck-associated protein 5 [Labeo rohita]